MLQKIQAQGMTYALNHPRAAHFVLINGICSIDESNPLLEDIQLQDIEWIMDISRPREIFRNPNYLNPQQRRDIYRLALSLVQGPEAEPLITAVGTTTPQHPLSLLFSNKIKKHRAQSMAEGGRAPSATPELETPQQAPAEPNWENYYRHLLDQINKRQWQQGLFSSGRLPQGVQRIKTIIEQRLCAGEDLKQIHPQIQAIAKQRLQQRHSIFNRQKESTRLFYQTLQSPPLLDEEQARTLGESFFQYIEQTGWKIGLFSRAGTPKGIAALQTELALGRAGKKPWSQVLTQVQGIAKDRLAKTSCFVHRDKNTEAFYKSVASTTFHKGYDRLVLSRLRSD
jgi:hypothetical protein